MGILVYRERRVQCFPQSISTISQQRNAYTALFPHGNIHTASQLSLMLISLMFISNSEATGPASEEAYSNLCALGDLLQGSPVHLPCSSWEEPNILFPDSFCKFNQVCRSKPSLLSSVNHYKH